MHITIETITPDRAQAWLNQNTNNRSLRDGVVERYAADMKAGRWTECPEPISFYEDGALADGQHRLFAIIESETSQNFPVARGVPRSAGLNINTGLVRNIVDNARISGADDGLSPMLLSAARAIHHGTTQVSGESNATKLDIVREHREAAQWVSTNMKRTKYLCSGPLIAAVGRAWYHEDDKDRLKRFCDVLGHGMMDNHGESAAVALRNYIMQRGTTAASTGLWRDTFLKAQNAIRYFMQGKKLTVIKAVNDEPYPLKRKRAAPKARN